ncbi:MAG: hypothetical protein Q4A59_03125 [Erysipelotrichaceae bacterium]|nr:hypothetical protein [Erysipelotrichaceae bacterium]
MKLNKMFAAMLSSVLVGATLVGCGSSDSSKLNVLSTKTVELGDPVYLAAAEFLSDNSQDINVADITVESDLKTDDFQYTYNQMNDSVTSRGKEYLALGTYEVTLKYKDQSYPVRLVVKDTTMPEFISPAAVVTVPMGNEDYDFSKVYRTRDKDKVTISINGDYDLTTEGKYPVTVVATDASGNTNSLEITIKVVGKNQQISASDQFDNEVPSDPDSETDSSTNDDPLINDNANQNQGTTTTPNACTISNAPVGTSVYYSFSDLYTAGTNWNSQNPNNYFFYLEGQDDCGNKVYFLTTGTSSETTPPIITDPNNSTNQPQTDDQQVVNPQ